MSVGVPLGNVKSMGVVSFTLDASSVSANSSAEETVTVQGLKTTDFVAVSKPSHDTGVVVGSARVSAANTLAIQLINSTGSGVDPSSETYLCFWARPEGSVSTVKE